MLKQIKLGKSKDSIERVAKKACETLKKGGIILYPTDTVYGLGVDALNDRAVRRLYKLKQRSMSVFSPIIVADMEMAEQYVVINEKERKLAVQFWPGALTIILPKKPHTGSEIKCAGNDIGVRVPDNKFCLELLSALGRPITSTSANISGKLTRSTIASILEQFEDMADEIDLAVCGGEQRNREPSTVVDLRYGELKIIRDGVVSLGGIEGLGLRELNAKTPAEAPRRF